MPAKPAGTGCQQNNTRTSSPALELDSFSTLPKRSGLQPKLPSPLHTRPEKNHHTSCQWLIVASQLKDTLSSQNKRVVFMPMVPLDLELASTGHWSVDHLPGTPTTGHRRSTLSTNPIPKSYSTTARHCSVCLAVVALRSAIPNATITVDFSGHLLSLIPCCWSPFPVSSFLLVISPGY